MNPLKLGIIGISSGNGHPYSWAAIFNGYNDSYMKDCPYPIIYSYLKDQHFPQDSIRDAQVTHIWTQDPQQSEHIAMASNIPNLVTKPEDLIGNVDAILLARDDSENHFHHVVPFLKAGLPIYIDKPMATTVSLAKELFTLQKFDWQIFSCSALRYAKEFQVTSEDLKQLGDVRFIEANVPRSWEKYAIHVIEPICNILSIYHLEITETRNVPCGNAHRLMVTLKNGIILSITSFGDISSDISILVRGTAGFRNLIFKDSFFAFRESLKAFIAGVQQQKIVIPRDQTLSIVKLIELGQDER